MKEVLHLSDFLINKKVKFIENEKGEIILEEVSNIKNVLIGKELTWYAMTKEKLEGIRDNVIKEGMGDEEFMYKIIPHICDIEVDITLEQFQQLTSIPSKEFNYILEGLVDYVNVLFEASNQTLELKDKIKETTNQTDITKEQLKNELYDLLTKTKDEEGRKNILKQLNSLENL